MPHKPGTKMRKADFEVPYPWSESVKYTRRYRDGWFDAYLTGQHTDKIGKTNSRGRIAYMAGFDAGIVRRPHNVTVSTEGGHPVRVTEFSEGTVTENWTPLSDEAYLREVKDNRPGQGTHDGFTLPPPPSSTLPAPLPPP